jgi:hypothetical protein
MTNHFEMFRHILQYLGNIFAQLAQLAATITLRLLRRVHLGFARQMLRQRTPCRFCSRCSNNPSPSYQRTLIRWPRRRSVTPAAIQIRVLAGSVMAATSALTFTTFS